jgi:hypothetical protein
MNSGQFILLLTATFPALAVLSFFFSLATYFRPPGAHAEAQDRVEILEELEDVVTALIADITALRRMVEHERQRTRRLVNEVGILTRLQRRSDETAEDTGDEAEPDDVHLHEQLGFSGVGLRGGVGSISDDEEALEAAAATGIPASPEENFSPTSSEPSTITQSVRRGRGEETRARMLVEQDTPAGLTNGESHTLTISIEIQAPLSNGYTNGTIHSPLTNGNVDPNTPINRLADTHIPLTNGPTNGLPRLPTPPSTPPITDDANERDYAETRELNRPLLHVLNQVRPPLGYRVIRDIMTRYIVAMGLGYADSQNRSRMRMATEAAIDRNEGINGFVDHGGIEDLSVDLDGPTVNGYYLQDRTGGGNRRARTEAESTNAFHINGGIVTRDNTSHDGSPLTNGLVNGIDASSQTTTPERLTAHPENIRYRPRLSTPELNEAIEAWGTVAHTPDGLVLRLRGDDESGHEFHLRQRPDTNEGEHAATDASTNQGSSLESSTRSSRSASLNGTTLVNSAAESLDGDAMVLPQSSENVELYRNGAYETPAAILRRRRGVRDMRRAAREDTRAGTRSTGSSEESEDPGLAEAEDTWWGLRDRDQRRDSMEEEMMQHALGRDRAV